MYLDNGREKNGNYYNIQGYIGMYRGLLVLQSVCMLTPFLQATGVGMRSMPLAEIPVALKTNPYNSLPTPFNEQYPDARNPELRP